MSDAGRAGWRAIRARAAGKINDVSAEVIMNFYKRYMVALALTGCAVALSAYVSRRHNQQVKARELQNALETWENEGGIVVASTARAADAY